VASSGPATESRTGILKVPMASKPPTSKEPPDAFPSPFVSLLLLPSARLVRTTHSDHLLAVLRQILANTHRISRLHHLRPPRSIISTTQWLPRRLTRLETSTTAILTHSWKISIFPEPLACYLLDSQLPLTRSTSSNKGFTAALPTLASPITAPRLPLSILDAAVSRLLAPLITRITSISRNRPSLGTSRRYPPLSYGVSDPIYPSRLLIGRNIFPKKCTI
jgi:hypothetical protein